MVDARKRGPVVIAGGSGFLGMSLARHLESLGNSVVLLSRRAPKTDGPWHHVTWDARTLGQWKDELDGASGLINLVGRTVDCIKTPDNRDEILRSRVEATRVLGLAVRDVDTPPPVWVQMSTAHIYGDPPQLMCTEESSFGCGLAPLVGKAWEQEFEASVLPEQRPVVLRTSFVVGRNGGALQRLMTLVRLGLGGTVGSGNQGMSWIHQTDLNRLFERGLEDRLMRGVYIASSPHPVSQKEFMRQLRRAAGVRIGLPAASWMVRIGAPLFMHTDPELALYGRYVLPQRLMDEQFLFHFPQLEDALCDILQKGGKELRATKSAA